MNWNLILILFSNYIERSPFIFILVVIDHIFCGAIFDNKDFINLEFNNLWNLMHYENWITLFSLVAYYWTVYSKNKISFIETPWKLFSIYVRKINWYIKSIYMFKCVMIIQLGEENNLRSEEIVYVILLLQMRSDPSGYQQPSAIYFWGNQYPR